MEKNQQEFHREAVIHPMKLRPEPYSMIASGQKIYELRLYDEKRRQIHNGDIIEFTNTVSGEKVSAKVVNLHIFPSFEELYSNLPLLQCGYTAENVNEAHHSDMEDYYSVQEQMQYRVVGIELAVEQ